MLYCIISIGSSGCVTCDCIDEILVLSSPRYCCNQPEIFIKPGTYLGWLCPGILEACNTFNTVYFMYIKETQAYALCLHHDCQTLIPRVLATWLQHGALACWGPPQTWLFTKICYSISVICLELLQWSKLFSMSAIKHCSDISVSYVIDG